MRTPGLSVAVGRDWIEGALLRPAVRTMTASLAVSSLLWRMR